MTGGGDPIRRVAIVGAGLVGGSIARAARAAGAEQVSLTDVSDPTRARAAELGLADQVVDTLAEAVHDADLVIAAVPTRAVPDVVVAAAAAAPAHAVLTDVASLKRDLTVDVESRLRDLGGIEVARRYVGGHPMAGSERSGPDAADAALFQGAAWILTPTSATDDAGLTRLSAFVRRLGARVVALSPERHDELVALMSHLPQLAASALADLAGEAADAAGEVVLAVAGGGFRDTTRIAASDPELWTGILTGNRPAVLDALDTFRQRLEDVRAALERDDHDELLHLLSRASAARRRLVPKVGEADVVDLVIALTDRPGALGAATTALGEAGVNVEDVAMRHAIDGGRGALLVRVAAAEASRAVAVLAEHGIAAHVEGPGTDLADPGA
jgi:prephenate dehydrogenase